MKCTKCGQENPSEALFCMKCGTKLERKCPQCGAEYPEKASFCMKCGLKLAEAMPTPPGTAAPRLEDMYAQLKSLIPDAVARKYLAPERQAAGENRPITALFADISGFTPLSATQSSEKMFQLVQDCFKQLVNIVASYEGSISGFRGDGLLALFGAPILHENDTERSILAAIDMRSAMRDRQLEVSIGINTALMTVGEIQTQLHREYTAYGAAINLAKRLQEAATPGQILVGAGTHRLAMPAFDFEIIPSLSLRGFPQPVTAYAVQQVKVHPVKLRGIEGLRAELIGREKELADLKECADNLLAGRGQIVSIIGEAGVGKSRLAAELKGYFKTQDLRQEQGPSPGLESRVLSPESIFWLEGGCISIGESIGYGVFIDILRSYLEFSDEDGSKEMAEKIVSKMKALFPQRWEDVVPYIGSLLSVKFGNEWDEKVKYFSPEQVKYQTDEVKYQTSLILRDLFLALANQKPLLLVLEDAHWADDLSLDLLSLLMDELTRAPLMLLCIYRPEKGHKSWRIGIQALGKCLGRYKQITLRELLPSESRRLVESLVSLLRIENLPEKVEESILREAGGNPFFVEEIIRSLIDSGIIYRDGERWVAKAEIEEIAVPDTIQSVIMARIDRLEEEVRYVLQCASVIGRRFRRKLLQYTTEQEQSLDRYLWQLEEKELVYEERILPEVEYSFKHVLTQETVYQSLLLNDRQALHQKVGQGIERVYQDRIEEFYEDLAWHYSQSGYSPKAIDYLMKAGEKAKSMYANQEAIRYFDRALEFIQAQPADEIQISLEMTSREALGDVFFTTGDPYEAEVQLKYALNLASKQQNVAHLAALTCKLADLIHWQSEFDRAIEMAESGLAALGDQIQSPEAASLLEVISRSYQAKWDLKSARRYTSQNAQIIHQIPYFDSIYKVYYNLAWSEVLAGDFQAANDWLEEMERVCLENDNEVGLARCYHGMGDLWGAQNDLRQACQWLEKSLIYCKRTGEACLLMEGHLELARYLILLDGNVDQIEAHIQRGLQIADQMAGTSQVASAPDMCRALGNAYLQKGNVEQAMLYFRRAIEFGPPDFHLSYLLCRLELLYVQQGRHLAFLDFCDRARRQTTFQSQTSLRYWHLQPGSPSADYPQLTWWDSFEEPFFREEWHWIDPQGKSSYGFVQQGILELRTPAGHELSPTNPDAPRLLRQISGDFAVEAMLVDITQEECRTGGLLLWGSEGMYLSFGKKSYRVAEVNEVHLEACGEIIGRGWLPGCQFYLRLERRGGSVSALCSNDSEKWQSCGETSFPADDPIWVGLYAACPASPPDCVMRFKEFRLFQQEAE